jgi:fused signal recognition particle receptor
MPSLLERFRAGLERTRTQVETRWKKLVGLKVSPEFWDELEASLYAADLGPGTVEDVVGRLRTRMAEDRPVSLEELRRLLADVLAGLLPPDDPDPLALGAERPHVVLVIGVNGTGKTTTVAKLAAQHLAQRRRVVLGAADTFRAAAVEQLATWAERLKVEVVRQGAGADPAAVAFDTVQKARARDADVALIDTAGRLHTKTPLMQELGKVARVVGREVAGAPHETLLVLDATTGQNGIQQARVFAEAVRPTGIVLTKLDGTAKGGVVFAIERELALPVKWVGVGEGVDDLLPFRRDVFVRAIVDAGASGA